MTNTTNYNLLLAEGTDLVNYLTQTNPNFSSLDTIIKGVSDDTVTPATEVTTGTAHAISRALPDATVIKFTATSNWQTGDTMTLDGTPVTPLKTDGTTLKTGDYIIGSAVLMIQDGARLTVLVASSPDAGDINYDNTVSGLTSNKVQGAVDELAADVNTINSNLSKNYALSSPTDITTYNAPTNRFVAPSEGLIIIGNGGSEDGRYVLYIEAGGMNVTSISGRGSYERSSLYIKKGSIVYVEYTGIPNADQVGRFHAYV